MRSRFIGGLALVLAIAAAATLSTATHARAADVAATKEVINVSAPAPLALAPVVVSQVDSLAPVVLDLTRASRAHSAVDVVMCVVAERPADSVAAVNDSLLGRLRVIVPRRFDSNVIPPSTGASSRFRSRSASIDSNASSRTSRTYRSS